MSITDIEVIKHIIQSQAHSSTFYVNSSKEQKNALNDFIQSEKAKEKSEIAANEDNYSVAKSKPISDKKSSKVSYKSGGISSHPSQNSK